MVLLDKLLLAVFVFLPGICQRARDSIITSILLLPVVWLTVVDHMLQWTSGELLAVHFDLLEGLLDVHLGVLVGDGHVCIVEHAPPDVLVFDTETLS